MSNYREIVLPKRPGCLTALAILYILAAGLYLLYAAFFGASFLFSPSELETGMSGLEIVLLVAVASIVPLAIGYGLWKLQSWAWWVVVISTSLASLVLLGMAISVLFINPTDILSGLEEIPVFITAINSFKAFVFILSVVGLVINGGMLFWFLNNRFLFVGHYYRYPAAETATEAKPTSIGIDRDLLFTVIAVGIICVLVILIGFTLVYFMVQ